MIYNILQKLQSHHFPVYVYSPPTTFDQQLFIQWGKNYMHINVNQRSYPDIIIHFPLTPVNVVEYKLRSYHTEIFPTEWALYGSFDNDTWILLSEKDEDLCTNSNKYSDDDPKLFCNGN